ncbi:MAG: arsenic metallochaperone ArsD family protein [Rhodospirillaceae bacterium]
MPRISIYDPPGCCSTGVCDPGLSDQMTQFATAIDTLMKAGHDVARYNMGTQPGAFVENKLVKATLDSDGMDCLPLVMLGDEIVSKGEYLDRAALGAKVGIDIPGAQKASACCAAEPAQPQAAEAAGCCGPAASDKAEEKAATTSCCG